MNLSINYTEIVTDKYNDGEKEIQNEAEIK